jgi:hypothetical protein
LITNPLLWLALSLLLVAVSLTAVLIAALPAFWELARAARSAEKLFDTLNQELPPTLEAIRLTGLEITDLTAEVGGGVQSATEVIKQVDQSILVAKAQAQKVQTSTRGLVAGLKAAWGTWQRSTTVTSETTDTQSIKKPVPNSVTDLAKEPVPEPIKVTETFSPSEVIKDLQSTLQD